MHHHATFRTVQLNCNAHPEPQMQTNQPPKVSSRKPNESNAIFHPKYTNAFIMQRSLGIELIKRKFMLASYD